MKSTLYQFIVAHFDCDGRLFAFTLTDSSIMIVPQDCADLSKIARINPPIQPNRFFHFGGKGVVLSYDNGFLQHFRSVGDLTHSSSPIE